MRFAPLLVVALLAAAPAAAQSQFWRVTGVEPGDVLNIRETPDPEGAIVGGIPANARRVRGFGCEETAAGQGWCRVKYGDVVGWSRARYLRPAEE